MAKVNKATLKSYFESGDIPNQSQYGDLIDSQFNLSEVDQQIINGTLSASAGKFDYLTLKKAYFRKVQPPFPPCGFFRKVPHRCVKNLQLCK